MILLLLACIKPIDDTGPRLVDDDLDGVGVEEDCDDTDGRVYPGNTETPYNGLDDDCDPETPDDDLDGDGALWADDCDDDDPDRHPGALESCDGVDQDCDGEIDEDATDASTWYDDADEDGYGDPDSPRAGCTQPEGTVTNADDCDDQEPLAWTDATELCDDVDNDCNGEIDDGLNAQWWYTDGDEDGFGDDDSAVEDCAQPSGTVDVGGDCDDGNADIKPDANGACALGASCDEALDNGYTDDGVLLIDPDGFDTGDAPFDAWCDQTHDDGGWTLLLSAEGSSPYWGNSSANWTTEADDTAPTTVDAQTTDFHGQAYGALETDEIRICYEDLEHCYSFEHSEGSSLLGFFTDGLTYTLYSYRSYGYSDVGDSSSATDYLDALGFTAHDTDCRWLGINDTLSGSSIGLLGDWNGGCSHKSGTYRYHDDLAIGVGLQSCYDNNSCSNGGTGHAAGQTRGANGTDDSGVFGPWHVFGR